jgi:outer membrane protein TolC
MKKFFLIMVCSTFVVLSYKINAQGIDKDSLNISTVITLTLENQPLVKQAEDQIRIAEAKIRQQETFNMPRVEAELDYTMIGPIPAFEVPGLGAFELAPRNNYNADVVVSYMIFDFNKRKALLDMLTSYKLTSEERVNIVKSELSYRAIQTFYSILFLEKSIKVKNEQINTLKEHTQIAKKKFDTGSVTDLDVLTTKVRVAAVENQRIEIQKNLDKQKVLLAALIGLNDRKTLKIKGDFSEQTLSSLSSSLVEQAYANREEIKTALLNEESIKLEKNVASLTDAPTISLFGAYGIKNGFEPNLDVWRGNWALGGVAKIPIFNGGLKDGKIAEADANLKASNDNIESLKRKIKAEVEQSDVEYNANKEALNTSKIGIEEAKQALEKSKIQYDNGVLTNLDLLDAEMSLTQAKLIYISALYQLTISGYQLKQSIGEKIWNTF